eukprot:429245_1
MENNNDEDTYLDSVYQYLQNTNGKQRTVRKLHVYIQGEQYDTDSIEYDIHMKDGNIAKSINKYECIQKIKNYMKMTKESSACFSIGLRFYYWDYYKEREQLDMDEQVVSAYATEINNYNSH